MEICLLTRFFDLRNAGLGRVAIEVRNKLEERGHNVHCVSAAGDSLYSYFWYTFYDIRRKTPKNADVYHALTPMEAIWLPKSKSVVTFHDLFQITHPNRLSSSLGSKGLKHDFAVNYFKFAVKFAARCRVIVAVSESTKIELVENLGIDPSHIHVIRSGISPFLDAKKPLNLSGLRLGYLGQLDRRKRVDLLVKAILNSGEDWYVDIAGTGPEGARLKRLAQGDSRIHFLGKIPDSDLSSFYNNIDVLVFPTWVEGYGLPIVEAMACGRPTVILEDAVIPSELYNKCAVVPNLNYALRDKQTLRDAIKDVDITTNYQWSKSVHNWNTTINAYERLYATIVE